MTCSGTIISRSKLPSRCKYCTEAGNGGITGSSYDKERVTLVTFGGNFGNLLLPEKYKQVTVEGITMFKLWCDIINSSVRGGRLGSWQE